MAENVTLGTVSSFTNDGSAVATVNANSQLIMNAFTDVLGRSGFAPNEMQSALDMNSFNIINLPAPATINSPVRLVDVISPGISLTVPPVGTSGSTVPLLNGINTWSGIQTFNAATVFNATVALNAGFTGSLTSSSGAQFINTSQVLTGSIAGPFNANTIVLTESLTVTGTNQLIGWSFIHTPFGGGSSNRTGLAATTFLTTSDIVAPFVTTMQATMKASVATTNSLSLFAFNPQALLLTGATNYAEICGTELDVSNASGASTSFISGLKIVQLSTHANHAVTKEGALIFTNQAPSVGWNNLIYVGSFNGGGTPMTATGTIFNVDSTVTAAVGIDMSTATLSSFAWKSPGCTIAGNGNINATAVISPSFVNQGSGIVLGNSTDTVKFGGTGTFTANGAVATTMTSLGPVGSHTTIQEWLTITDAAGVVRYIPCY